MSQYPNKLPSMLYETFKEKHGGKNLLKQAFLMSNLRLLHNISQTFFKIWSPIAVS